MSEANEEEALLQDFILESEEHLEDVEKKTVQLETDGDDPELINSLFRSFHTIKGNANWLGFSKIVEITHAIESLLGEIRNNKRDLEAQIFDIILEVKDIVSEQIEQIKSGKELTIDASDLIKKIEDIRS